MRIACGNSPTVNPLLMKMLTETMMAVIAPEYTRIMGKVDGISRYTNQT